MSYLREYAMMLHGIADEMEAIADMEEKESALPVPVLASQITYPETAEVLCRSVYKMSPTIGREGISRFIKNELVRYPDTPVGLEDESGYVYIIRNMEDLNKAMSNA